MKTSIIKYLGLSISLVFSFHTITLAQWVSSSNGLEGSTVTNLHIDDNMLFACTYAGVYRSTDKGITWTAVNNGLYAINVSCVAGTGKNLFAGTISGVYHSIDNGEHWAKSSIGLAHKINCLLILSNKIFAGTDAGIFLSNDNGTSWQTINNGVLENSIYLDVTRLSESGGKIYAVNGGRIFESEDNGANWSHIQVGESVISLLAFNDSLFGILDYPQGIFQSVKNVDLWSSWVSVGSGLPKNPVQFCSVAAYGGAIFLGTDSTVYTSTDSGISWEQVGGPFPEKNGVWSFAFSEDDIYVGSNHGVYHTQRVNGIWTNWSALNKQLTNVQAHSFVSRGDYLFAGTDNGVYRSTDGSSWQRFSNGLVKGANFIKHMEANESTIFAGTQEGIYKSEDDGAHWKLLSGGGLPTRKYTSALAVSGNKILTGMNHNGSSGDSLYLSVDNGTSWTRLTLQGQQFTQITGVGIH